MAPKNALVAGIYSPTMTFFTDDEELDLDAIAKHSVRLAKAGLVGLVTMGSNGEAVHLSRAERIQVTKTTREALDGAGFKHIPVIVGASEQSIRGTVELCKEAAGAGGEYVLLVPPSYYRYAMDIPTLKSYFIGVADASPIPIILYNYPGAVAGIDMDSDLIIELSQHPNIVGTKFTCGNTGKLTRVARALNAITPASPVVTANANAAQAEYMAFGGMADFTLQTLVSGGSGIIAGGANVLPRLIVKVWSLWEEGKVAEAVQLQSLLSQGDWVLTKTAIPGTKAAIQTYYGYGGGRVRAPLKKLDEAGIEAVKAGTAEAIKAEFELKDVA